MTVDPSVIGITLAVASAVALSLGNIWQSQGVQAATAVHGAASMARTLLRTRVWLLGTLMFGLAIVLQMSSLAFAPIMLVQPIGVLALVFSVFINAKISGVKPTISVVRAVLIALSGVAVYVTVASMVTSQAKITDRQLIEVLLALVIALLIAVVFRLTNRGGKTHIPILYVLLAGMFSAFVATLGKTVIMRVEALFSKGHFEFGNGWLLTLTCLIALGLCSALSIYFTQTAYTCNHSDVVVAGLTVVDPAIAVLLGIVILKEATGAPIWSMVLIAAAGAVAVYGVIRLALEENAPAASPEENAPTTPAPEQ